MDNRYEIDLLRSQRVNTVDGHLRRYTNMAPARDSGDYVTLAQLTQLLAEGLLGVVKPSDTVNNITNNNTYNGTGPFYTITWAASVVVDHANGFNQSITLTGNTSFSFSGYSSGDDVWIEITQDATGNRTDTWTGAVRTPGSGSVISFWAGSVSYVHFKHNGTNMIYVGGQMYDA